MFIPKNWYTEVFYGTLDFATHWSLMTDEDLMDNEQLIIVINREAEDLNEKLAGHGILVCYNSKHTEVKEDGIELTEGPGCRWLLSSPISEKKVTRTRVDFRTKSGNGYVFELTR